MTDPFPGLIKALHGKMAGLNYLYEPKTVSLNVMMWSCKCFLRVSTIQTLTYNWMNSVVFKNVES